MDYIYYAPVRSNQHMFYASELAQRFTDMTGWKSSSGKINIRLIAEHVQKCEANDERVQTSLYYAAKNGLRRVYPYGIEYINGLESLLQIEADSAGGREHATLTIGNTKYHLYRKK